MPEFDFTVITVTLNSERTLKRCLDSVSAQTNVSVQHVIKDCASKDSTVAIAINNPITDVYSTPDSGIYDAMNQAISFAKGEYIHFLNSDDRFSNTNILEKAFKKMHEEKLDVLFTGIRLLNEVGQQRRSWPVSSYQKNHKFGISQAPHPGMFIKREVFNNSEYLLNPNFRISSDYELQLKLSRDNSLKRGYLHFNAVDMFEGGISTRSVAMIFLGLKECVIILRNAEMSFPICRVMLKFLGKIFQKFF